MVVGTLWLVGMNLWFFAALTIYWGAFDRTPPVTINKESKAIFNAGTYKLQLVMNDTRHRWCRGVRHGYLEDGFRQVLPDISLPSNVYEEGHDRPGETFTAYPEPITVDPRIKDSFDVHLTLEYWCNDLQKEVSPTRIVVQVPPMHVFEADWVR